MTTQKAQGATLDGAVLYMDMMFRPAPQGYAYISQPGEAPQPTILLWDSAAQRLDPSGGTYAGMATDSK